MRIGCVSMVLICLLPIQTAANEKEMSYGRVKTFYGIGTPRNGRRFEPLREGIFHNLFLLISPVLRWKEASNNQMALNRLTSFACREN